MTASLSWVTVSVKMGSFAWSSFGNGAGRIVNRLGRERNELTKSTSGKVDVDGPEDVEDDEEGELPRYGGYS